MLGKHNLCNKQLCTRNIHALFWQNKVKRPKYYKTGNYLEQDVITNWTKFRFLNLDSNYGQEDESCLITEAT